MTEVPNWLLTTLVMLSTLGLLAIVRKDVRRRLAEEPCCPTRTTVLGLVVVCQLPNGHRGLCLALDGRALAPLLRGTHLVSQAARPVPPTPCFWVETAPEGPEGPEGLS